MLIGVSREMVTSLIPEHPVEPIYNSIGAETVFDLPGDTYPRLVQIPQVDEFPLDVIRNIPKKSEFS
jgi:hypothetical protein